MIYLYIIVRHVGFSVCHVIGEGMYLMLVEFVVQPSCLYLLCIEAMFILELHV